MAMNTLTIHKHVDLNGPTNVPTKGDESPTLKGTLGHKADAGKPRMELLSPEALEGLAKVMTFGAAKYGDRNWEKGLTFSRVFGAGMRHMWAWWRGEDIDPESGLSHLDHAAFAMMTLSHFNKRRRSDLDDRPAPPQD